MPAHRPRIALMQNGIDVNYPGYRQVQVGEPGVHVSPPHWMTPAGLRIYVLFPFVPLARIGESDELMTGNSFAVFTEWGTLIAFGQVSGLAVPGGTAPSFTLDFDFASITPEPAREVALALFGAEGARLHVPGIPLDAVVADLNRKATAQLNAFRAAYGWDNTEQNAGSLIRGSVSRPASDQPTKPEPVQTALGPATPAAPKPDRSLN